MIVKLSHFSSSILPYLHHQDQVVEVEVIFMVDVLLADVGAILGFQHSRLEGVAVHHC